MAITYDNSASGSANSATSVNCAVTVGSLTSGLMLIFCADQNSSNTITTPTVNGSSSGVVLVDTYTQDPAVGGVSFIKLYKKLAPASGSNTVAFTATSNHLAVAAVTFDGVDQTTPLGTVAHARNGASTTPSVTVTTTSGDVVAEFFAWFASNGSITFTNDGSQTSRQNNATGNQGIAVSQETASGASTVASGTLSGTIAWGAMAVPILVASAASGLAHLLSGKLSNLLAGKLE